MHRMRGKGKGRLPSYTGISISEERKRETISGEGFVERGKDTNNYCLGEKIIEKVQKGV